MGRFANIKRRRKENVKTCHRFVKSLCVQGVTFGEKPAPEHASSCRSPEEERGGRIRGRIRMVKKNIDKA